MMHPSVNDNTPRIGLVISHCSSSNYLNSLIPQMLHIYSVAVLKFVQGKLDILGNYVITQAEFPLTLFQIYI